MQCMECGTDNTAGSAFCVRCGITLGGGGSGSHAAPAPRPAPGGAVRKTVFEAPDAGPPAYVPPTAGYAPPAGGYPPPVPGARKTTYEGEMPPAAPMPRAAAPAPAGGRSRTMLDEGPVAAPAPAAPGAPARAPSGVMPQAGTARIVGWMVSFDKNPSGQEYVIRAGRTRMGRSRDNDIALFFEPKSSDLHATLIYRNGQCAIKDEGSTNGTMVNGEDIGIGSVQQLQTGDSVTIGESSFLVFLIAPDRAKAVWPNSGWN